MNPLYFGDPARQLFGLYEPPRGAVTGDHGVVLCYPGPQEYMRTHWAVRKLGRELARAGLHVLRFDYYGTGDSAGASEAGGLDEWTANVGAAIAELKDVGGVSRVSLVGLRLGAALALRAAAAPGVRVRDLVLWEPVVDGRAYLSELEAIGVRKYARLLFHEHERDDELLGYLLPQALRDATAAVDLRAAPPPSAERVRLFFAQPRPEYGELTAALTARGVAAEAHHVPEDPSTVGKIEAALLSSNVLKAITQALSGRRADA